MKKQTKLAILIGIISFVVTACTVLTTVFLVLDKKKKDDEELMDYLDSSIE